jgi:hypothetical protein
MSRILWLTLIGVAAVAAAAGVAVVACLRHGSDGPTPAEAPADNSFCLVCHANYQKEGLAANHAKAGVGCMKCHGSSDAHSSDEDGLTPPEIMYPKDRIQPSCMACHPQGQLARKKEHADVLAGASSRVCTDCHGDHRLKVRTRRWDKKTGKLVADDGVRMMTVPGAKGC